MKNVINYIIILYSLCIINNVYAYFPPAECSKSLQNEYEQSCFFSYNDYFINDIKDCRKIYYLSRDIVLLKLIFRSEDDISFERYIKSQYPHVTKREYIQILTYVNTINEILDNSICMNWMNTNGLDDFIKIVPNFFYNKCIKKY
jgi:hypothetical protein